MSDQDRIEWPEGELEAFLEEIKNAPCSYDRRRPEEEDEE